MQLEPLRHFNFGTFRKIDGERSKSDLLIVTFFNGCKSRSYFVNEDTY